MDLQEKYFNYMDSPMEKRLINRSTDFVQRIVEQKTSVINQLSKERAFSAGAYRYINNENVTFEGLKNMTVSKTVISPLIKDKDIIVINDTSEYDFFHHEELFDEEDSYLGKLSNKHELGFFAHPGLVLDKETKQPLGYSYMKIWNLPKDLPKKKERKYTTLPIEDKMSYRWIECATESKKVLSEAKNIYLVSDREGDIYEEFYRVPDEKTHLVIRSRCDRLLHEEKKRLYAKLSESPCLGTYSLEIKAEKKKKRKKRNAIMEVRVTQAKIKQPSNLSKHSEIPSFVEIGAIEAKESIKTVPQGEKPIHWIILTTCRVETFEQARGIIDIYDTRWNIELLFGITKGRGLNLEESGLHSGVGLQKLCYLVMQAALILMVLKEMSRTAHQALPVLLFFTADQVKMMEEAIKSYEGKTDKQKNNHTPFTMPWAGWLIARIGGWKGYQSQDPPGDKTYSKGYWKLIAMYDGWKLAQPLKRCV